MITEDITDIDQVGNVLKATGQRFRLAEFQEEKTRFGSWFEHKVNLKPDLKILVDETDKHRIDPLNRFLSSLPEESLYLYFVTQVVPEERESPNYDPVIRGLKEVLGNIPTTPDYIEYWTLAHEITRDISEISQPGSPDVIISEQLQVAVDRTIKLALETVPSCKPGTPEVQSDPEVEDYWWISIPIRLNCGVDEAISYYEALIEKFTDHIAGSEADKIRIDIQMEE